MTKYPLTQRSEMEKLKEENRCLKTALGRIAKWFGEFPPSGAFLSDGTPISYGSEFGSDGERDFMRKIASDALEGK